MLVGLKIYIAIIFFFVCSISAKPQENIALHKDSVLQGKSQTDVIGLLMYGRVIMDSKNLVRTDQNFVGNFKLINWLKAEAGIRVGERLSTSGSYYHYKLELQTKYFWNTIRIIGRLSNDIIAFASPFYRKTNELLAIEAKYPLSKSIHVAGGLGYLYTWQQNVPDALPTNKGILSNYPIFKLGLRYVFEKKGFLELSYGTYDVFNPYSYNSPFAQILGDVELSELCTFTSYFRYQYNNNVFTPGNYFFSAGVKLHLLKG